MTNDGRLTSDAFIIEGDERDRLPQIGFTTDAVVQPGQSGGRYHREANQDRTSVVLAWRVPAADRGRRSESLTGVADFVHVPAEHRARRSSRAGDGPCVIFMTGAREG